MSNHTPICEAVKRYNKNTKSRWHTPGHMGGELIPEALKDWGKEVWKDDVTEVDGLDYLLNETGAIAEAERLTAKLYGVDETLFFTQGSTSGIQAAILAVVKPGEKILVQRHSHISIWNALILSGAEPIWLTPEYDKWDLVKPFSVKDLELKLDENPDIMAVVLQNPTYEGKAGNIKKAVELIHSYKIPIIVDEAHGAHWHFSSCFPLSGVDAGADIVVQSAHKTLPALTGGAWVHCQGKQVNKNQLAMTRSLIHSSSPSYLIMASLDACRAYLGLNAEKEYSNLLKLYYEFHARAKQSKVYCLLPIDFTRYDFSKINVHFLSQSSKIMVDTSKKCGIMFEKSEGKNILFLATPGTKYRDFRMLKALLDETVKGLDNDILEGNRLNMFQVPNSGKNIYNPREMFYKEKELCSLTESVGRVAAVPVSLSPPGVPIILPGEEITLNFVNYVIREKELCRLAGLSFRNNEYFIRVVK